MRTPARITAVVGALGSVGLTLYAGRQNPSSLLMVVFAIWVLSPFVLLFLADRASMQRAFLSRPVLNVATLAVTAISLITYAARVLRPPKAQAAFVFVVVPPVCWFLIAGALAGAAWSSRGRSKSSTKPRSFVPEGWPSVIPRIFAEDPRQLAEFVKLVFDAAGDYQDDRPSVLRIGESVIMISDAEARGPVRAFLYVYVADADATYQRALDAGARSLEPPSDMPYGDRRGMVEDEWGNTWQIATYRGGR